MVAGSIEAREGEGSHILSIGSDWMAGEARGPVLMLDGPGSSIRTKRSASLSASRERGW